MNFQRKQMKELAYRYHPHVADFATAALDVFSIGLGSNFIS